jgi:hypothetical protein
MMDDLLLNLENGGLSKIENDIKTIINEIGKSVNKKKHLLEFYLKIAELSLNEIKDNIDKAVECIDMTEEEVENTYSNVESELKNDNEMMKLLGPYVTLYSYGLLLNSEN